MRNTLFCLLMVGCISTFAQNGTTFKVENLSKPEKLLFIKSYEDIYKGLILSDLKIYPYEIKEKNINVQSAIVKTFLSRKLGIIRDCIAGIAVHGLNGSGKMR